MHKKLNKILIILLVLTAGFTYVWCAPTTGQIGALSDFLHDIAMNNHAVYEVATIQFNDVYAIGVSGSAEAVDWDNGQYQSITISENTDISFVNEFVGTITLVMTYTGGDYTVALTDTILEEGGTELDFTELDGTVDILKVMNLGTADTFVVGVLLDVKD
jgi:hypothetical protein